MASKELLARINASPDADAIKRARQAIGNSNAVRSGRRLQDELDDTHRSMAQRGWGCVYPHARETVGTPNTRDGSKSGLGLRYKKGGNPVDYTGFVNLLRLPKSDRWEPSHWNGGSQLVVGPGIDDQQRVPVIRLPVVFDAKRTQDNAYRHDPDALHQLLQLREAAKNGAAAFLFIHHVPTGCGFIVGAHHLDTLIGRRPLQLIETKTKHPLHPFCTYQLGTGWRYAELLPVACLGLRL